VKPLRRLLLCRELPVEDTIPGGRIALLPSTLAAITQQQAEVVAVGAGEFDEDGDYIASDPRLKPGTWILHKAFQRVASGNPDEFFIHEDDVVAILEAECGPKSTT